MKKITTLLGAYLMLVSMALAQAPEGINYQAVARNSSGTTLNNRIIGMELKLRQGAADGTVVYSETHKPTTSDIGLLNLSIGTGTPVSGVFADIDWSAGPYFVQVGMDVQGGSNYVLMGSQKLMSVPYSLYAKKSESAKIKSQFDSGIGGGVTMNYSFIGPTLTVTVEEGEKVIMNAVKALGSTKVNGAKSLTLFVGYMLLGDITPTKVGGGILNLECAPNTSNLYPMNGVIEFPQAGTYIIGIVGKSLEAANWDRSEWGYITAIITE